MKRVVVVGASGALGRAVTTELTSRDARVGGTYRTSRPEGISVRKLDLLAVDSIEPVLADLTSELDGADALVVCATAVSASAMLNMKRRGRSLVRTAAHSSAGTHSRAMPAKRLILNFLM